MSRHKCSGHLPPKSLSVKGKHDHPTKPRYKVEMRYLRSWGDAGWTVEYDSGPRPMSFSSREKAQAEIAELIAAVKEAVQAGDMEDASEPDDYSVVEEKV